MRELALKTQAEKRLAKTVSRKAASRQASARASPAQSRRHSPANSQPPSVGSTDGWGSSDSDSDGDALDDLGSSGGWRNDNVGLEDARSNLSAVISDLQDLKRRNVEARMLAVQRYLAILRYNPGLENSIKTSLPEILESLVKRITKYGDRDEQKLALKALTVTVLTAPEEPIYEQTSAAVKAACQDSEDEAVKAEALSTLAVLVVYGSDIEGEMQEFLEFTTRIIESDGDVLNATDSAAVVIAALQAFSFVATMVDSLEERAPPALTACVDQLDSSVPQVQASAASVIAQLFEAERSLEEERQFKEEGWHGKGSNNLEATWGPLNLQEDPKALIARMKSIARTRSTDKRISRKERHLIRSNLDDVITSLELGKGPGWSTSGRSKKNPHVGGSDPSFMEDIEQDGYQGKVKVSSGRNGQQYFLITSWAVQARLKMLRWALGAQFGIHLEENEVVRSSLADLEPYTVTKPGR